MWSSENYIYFYCFSDVILLSKCALEGRGIKYLGLLTLYLCTYFMDGP